MQIRSAEQSDAAAIAAIYNHYVATTCITFETDAVSPEDMAARIDDARDAKLPWLVAADGQVIAGNAYASKWKGRCAYRYSVESTVYLDQACTGRGIGKALYIALIDALRARDLHAVIGGIALPNDSSIALHERLGFDAPRLRRRDPNEKARFWRAFSLRWWTWGLPHNALQALNCADLQAAAPVGAPRVAPQNAGFLRTAVDLVNRLLDPSATCRRGVRLPRHGSWISKQPLAALASRSNRS